MVVFITLDGLSKGECIKQLESKGEKVIIDEKSSIFDKVDKEKENHKKD